MESKCFKTTALTFTPDPKQDKKGTDCQSHTYTHTPTVDDTGWDFGLLGKHWEITSLSQPPQLLLTWLKKSQRANTDTQKFLNVSLKQKLESIYS